MKKLLALFLLGFSLFSYAEVHQADTCVGCKLVSPEISGGTASGITGISDNGVLVNSTGTTATLRSLWKDLSSSGWIEGFEITDAGGGTVDVAIGEFVIRSGTTATSPIYYENTISGLTGVTIPSNTTRYLIGDWNAGTPSIAFQTSDTSNGFDKIYLGEVHNVAGTLMIHSDPQPAGDAVNRIQSWAVNVIGDRVSSGNVTYDPSAPSRKVGVTAGTIEVARSLSTETQALVDTNAAGTFTAIYGTPTYTYVAAQTQWNNAQYDNAGTLTAMTAGWYGNHYVIRGYNGAVVLMYGRAQYATEAAAIAEATPTDRPEQYVEHGMVIAKITFLNGAATYSTITDLRPVINSSAPTALAPTSHPNLTSLAWGSSGHTGTASMVAGFNAGGVAVNRPLGTPILWASIPAAASVTAYSDQYLVTDFVGNPMTVFSDGTKWRTAVQGVAYKTVNNSTAATVETLLRQDNINPGNNFLKVGDTVVYNVAYIRNNATNASTFYLRIGSTGVLATDTLIGSAVIAAATAPSISGLIFFVVTSNTTADFISVIGGATVQSFTIPDITANPVYLSFSAKNNGAGTTITQYGNALVVSKN